MHLQQRGLLLKHGGLLLQQIRQNVSKIDRRLIRHAPSADHSSGSCS
jgi:hypothetical protein